MTDKENKLIDVERRITSLANSPVTQIDIARRLNTRVYEIFEIERLLNELNTRLFENKGKIIPVYQEAHIRPGTTKETEVQSQSRFRRLFNQDYQAQNTQLGSELYVEKKDLPNPPYSKYLEGLGIKTYQIVDVQDETFALHVLGKLYFSARRTHSGRWDNSPTLLTMQSQGRILEFSLYSIPPANEIKIAFLKNLSDILKDFSSGNFISISDERLNEYLYDLSKAFKW